MGGKESDTPNRSRPCLIAQEGTWGQGLDTAHSGTQTGVLLLPGSLHRP